MRGTHYPELCACHKPANWGHPPPRIPVAAIINAATDGKCPICGLVYSALMTALEGNVELNYTIMFKLKDNGEFIISYWKADMSTRQQTFEVYLAGAQPSLPAPLQSMGNFREVHDDPAGPECLERIREMIRFCEAVHQDCKTQSSRSLPRRVLEITAGLQEAMTVRLYVSKDGEESDYLALSHCWGDAQPLTTTIRTLEKRRQGIEWADLPPTFQDALRMTQALGKRFLWIDSLCILQDDHDDWVTESMKMGDIYQNAYLTLAASASPSAAGGMLVKRTSHLSKEFAVEGFSDTSSTKFKVREALGKHHRHDIPGMIRDSWRSDLIQPAWPMDALETRAWTFQERLVSRRLLSFRGKEVEWDCRGCCDCECGARYRCFWVDGWNLRMASSRQTYQAMVTMAEFFSSKNAPSQLAKWRDRVYEEWFFSVVATYTQLRLTKESDRLPALSAIAKQLEIALNDSYVCGLWRQRLADGMTWRSGAFGTNPPTPGRLTKSYRAPSWSWASIEGPVDTCYDREAVYEPIFHVELTDVVPATSNRYGDVASASARVVGHMVPATLSCSQGDDGKLKYSISIKDAAKTARRFWPDTRLSLRDGTLQRSEEVADISPISSAPVQCLAALMSRIRNPKDILKPPQDETVDFDAPRELTFIVVTPSKRQQGAYERIGLLKHCLTVDMPVSWHVTWPAVPVEMV